MSILRRQSNGYGPDGRRTLHKGGGGGSGTPYYSNMDRLYGVQAQAAQYMLDQSMPYLPTYMSNSNEMVSDAMDGTLATQMRTQAANDTAGAIDAGISAANRNAERYGIGSSTDRLVSEANRNAVLGAATKAGAVNQATANAEEMKWNRNAGGLAQATGMGSGAMNSIGSAASGYGSAANSINASNAQNAAGYGQFGAAVASSFKDGGAIKGEFKRLDDKPGLHMAMGGDAWSAYKSQNPIQTSGRANDGGGSGLSSVMAGAAPIVIGKGLKAAMGSDVVKNAGSQLYAAARNSLERALGADQTQAPAAVADKSTLVADAAPTGAETAAADTAASGASTSAAGSAAADAAGTTAADAAGTAAADAAAGAATDAAATAATDVAATAATDVAATAATEAAAAAGAEAAAGSVAAANAWNPVGWVAGGLMAANALGLFDKDGGDVSKQIKERGIKPQKTGKHATWKKAVSDVQSLHNKWADGGDVVDGRKDMTPGGAVSGPGTETSDSIPSWLSKGEVVENAVATKLAGKDALVAINDIGLSVRYGKQSPEQAKQQIGKLMLERGKELAGNVPGLKMAMGGRVPLTPDVFSSTVLGQDQPGAKFDPIGTAVSDMFADGGYVKPGLKMADGGFLGGNLGVALGAGAQAYTQQKRLDQQQKMQDQQMALATAQNDRAQQQFDMVKDVAVEKKQKDKQAAEILRIGMPAIAGSKQDKIKYLVDHYNKNNPSAGYNDGMTVDVSETKDGAVATFKDASGKPVRTQNFTNEQIAVEPINAIYSQLASVDAETYAKPFMNTLLKPIEEERIARAKQLAKNEGRQEALQDAITLEREKAKIRAQYGLTSHGGGRSGGGDDSKGAKFDVDGEGNRVILYRNGQMVYPKDAQGNPVKIKAGTDQDQKFTRELIKTYAGKDIVAPNDPVAKAQSLTEATRSKPSADTPAGLPAGARQIGTSGGKPVYQTPDGKKFIVK